MGFPDAAKQVLIHSQAARDVCLKSFQYAIILSLGHAVVRLASAPCTPTRSSLWQTHEADKQVLIHGWAAKRCLLEQLSVCCPLPLGLAVFRQSRIQLEYAMHSNICSVTQHIKVDGHTLLVQ